MQGVDPAQLGTQIGNVSDRHRGAQGYLLLRIGRLVVSIAVVDLPPA